ncbi:hypothetical protein PRZ48_013046 [Zasmidium cellare]|uniref:2EXR domain-containing protein n=1 Tax=Zasmidium cellare TaxID=395010 RepID=A0ABR0E3T8_ZASCE|nr:hypothetical protein PRZ48_013046 [Zasmidium cellare]
MALARSNRAHHLPSPDPSDSLSAAQHRGSLLNRVQSYSRIMHTYTMLQMQYTPTTTLPSYQKAMYKFTQQQMERQRSRSETSSPHIGAQQAVLPEPVALGMLEEVPPPPCSTPEPGSLLRRERGVKLRSTTEPIPRDFAVGVKERAAVACGKLAPLFWKPKPKAQTPDLFTSLPAELRNRVYALIVPTGRSFEMSEGPLEKKKGRTKPKPKSLAKVALLRVSKQVRVEASCVFYGNNRFRMDAALTSRQFATHVEVCRNIVKTCGPRPFYRLVFDLNDVRTELFKEIEHLLPLLELMRDLQFEPDQKCTPGVPLEADDKASSIDSGSSVFKGVRYVIGRHVLGRAIVLGRRARDERWTESELQEKFTKFIEFAAKGNQMSMRKKPRTWPTIF